MPSEWEGAIPDEIRHDEVSRRLLFFTGLPDSRGRVKRDQTREVEGLGGFDSVGPWEEDAPESNKDTPERAQQVVHLVESRRGTNGEVGWCWKTDDQTRTLYEYTPMPSECPSVYLIGSGTTKRNQEKKVELGAFPLSHTRRAA